MGNFSGSNGIATVTGSGSKILAGSDGSGAIYVGREGSGTLYVNDGGIAECAGDVRVAEDTGSVGQVTVDGTGSLLKAGNRLYVGANAGNGTLNVQNGGVAESTNAFRIGNLADATGTVTVTGPGSLIDAATAGGDDLWVGNSGNGTLNVQDGGRAQVAQSVRIGIAAGAVGQVTVDGIHDGTIASSLHADNNLIVGGTGQGTLMVQNGGQASAGVHLRIATNSGSTGNMTIDGSLSQANITNSVAVGGTVDGTAGGTGTLNVTNGGQLNVGNTLRIYSGSSVTLDALSTMSATHIVANGDLNWTGGTLEIGAGESLSGSGDFSDVGMVTVADGGMIAPGNSTGTITGGDLTWGPGGMFELEVNDFLGTAGSASLGWDLLSADSIDITATSFNPFQIDLLTLDIAQASGLAANFDGLTPYSLPFATTTAGITGFDSSAFNVNTTGVQNTFTGTWSVSQSGNNLSLEYTTAAVPEPSSLLLVAVGVYPLLRRRRRQLSTSR